MVDLDKIFRVNRPRSLPWGSWNEWRANFKKSRPITYFIVEQIPLIRAWIKKYTVGHFNDFAVYCSNRFVTQTHKMVAPSLKKGKMHELSTRMLHCNFDAYVKWCETEASVDRLWTDDAYVTYTLPWYARTWLSNFITIRSPQCVIDHFKWEMSLMHPDEGSSEPTLPEQAKIAFEKMSLYVWWTKLRPAREDSWNSTGFSEFWNKMDEKYGDDWFWPGVTNSKVLDQGEIAMYNKLSAAQSDADEAQHIEDQEMLERLIKIRESLWT